MTSTLYFAAGIFVNYINILHVDKTRKSLKAIWNGTVITGSHRTIEIQGNHHFPPNTVDKQHLKGSRTHATCHWKGEASYYHLIVDGKVSSDAPWCYLDPKDAASKIKGYVAFWKGMALKN